MKKRGNISIKAKLLGVITPVVIAIVVVLVLVSYLASAHIIENYSQNLLESSVENQTSKIESWLDENLSSFQMAKTTIEQLNPDDAQLQTILDSYYGYSDNYPDGLYVSDSNGNLLKASKSTKSESSPTKSTWYTEGLTRVNMTIGSAYKNAEGVNVISASGILKDNSDRIRVISADMTLDRISIIVNSFIEMDDAQTFLVDKNSGTILADRDSSLISQKLGASGQSSFYQDMAQRINDQNYDFTTIDGEMTVSQEVQGTDWILVSYIPKSTVLADLVALRTRMIVIGVICIILLCVLIERMTHVVVKPVKEMTNVITQMASGDFTVSVNPRGNDEIAVMGYSVQHFIESMKQMITQIGQVSQILSEQAQSSKSVSTELNSATEIQSRSMGELNSTVDQLAVSVNEIAENATQLAGVAADTKKDSDVVDVKMRETVEVSEKGRQDMEKVSKALEGIELSIHNLQEAVDKVGTASGEIVDIINLIGSIAEETNLLSLNASIEAARAGEAGRGFAVVASEISQMAQQTKDSTVQISQLIENVSNAIQMVVEVSGSMISMIESQNETTEKTAESFTVIEKNSDNVYGQSNELAAYVTKLADANKKIIDSISTISAISEEVAAHASDTLSATESNNVIVEELAALSGQLETLAQELKEQ